MLDIYLDFKSPAAYLAMQPSLAFLAARPVPVQWRPFRVRERDVPQRGADETVGQSHRRVRAESRRRIFLHYAAVQGIEMTFPETRHGTDLALGALAEIDGDRLAFVEACFAAYWSQHADLDDAGVVAALLAASGAVHSGDLSATRDRLEAALEEAEAAGVVDTPGYLIAGENFVGREHLPWIGDIIDAQGTL